MNSYKHSGTTGDLIYSLPIIKHFGGGNFYLHLDQINNIGMHYYGSAPQGYHQGRMNQTDLEILKPLMEYQTYITEFRELRPTDEITHNLDRFRKPFVGHPGNYVDIYSEVFGIRNPQTKTTLRTQPWLTAPVSEDFAGHVIVNRTGRWVPQELNPKWAEWREQGLDQKALFIGHPNEYKDFMLQTRWRIEYWPTPDLLAVAEAINSADMFIGNQSAALAMAIGLGRPFWCEARRDLPVERNECYFPSQPNGNYF
jgi:hypothetical protein